MLATSCTCMKGTSVHIKIKQRCNQKNWHFATASWVWKAFITFEKWAPSLSWLLVDSSVGSVLHRYHRGQGCESHSSLDFFRLNFTIMSPKSLLAVQMHEILQIHVNANSSKQILWRNILHGRMQTAKIRLLVPEGMNTQTAASVCKDV